MSAVIHAISGAGVADLPTDLERMAPKLREAGWAVREPAP
jgi:hypothetical protein